jgi:hypothetical protein
MNSIVESKFIRFPAMLCSGAVNGRVCRALGSPFLGRHPAAPSRERVPVALSVRPKQHSGAWTCQQQARTRRLLAFRTEPAHEIDDEAYEQNQAKPAAANDGTAKVKPAAAEQEKQNNHE